MRVRFRMQTCGISAERIDLQWVRRVHQHSKVVVIRVLGLCWLDRINHVCGQKFGGRRRERQYERMMAQFAGHHNTACLTVRWNRRLFGRKRHHKPFPVRRLWIADSQRMRRRAIDNLERLLWILRGHFQNQTLVVHAEDVACEWVLSTRFAPDVWLLENPLFSVEQALDLWLPQLERPGVLVHSSHWRMQPLLWSFYRRGPWEKTVSSHLKPHTPYGRYKDSLRPDRSITVADHLRQMENNPHAQVRC